MTLYVRHPGTPDAAYPYTFTELRASCPQVSFPATPSVALLAEYGVYPVVAVPPPVHDPTTHITEEAPPVRVAGEWTQQWTLRELTAEEIRARVPTRVTRLQGLRAIARAGLVEAYLSWKAGLDPVTDFEALAFIEHAQHWEYADPILNAALAALGVSAQKDALFTLAATL